MNLTDDELLAAMKPHIDTGDGGYLCDMEPEQVIAAGRAAIAALEAGRSGEAETPLSDVELLRTLCEDVTDMHPTVRAQLQSLAKRIDAGVNIGVTRCRRCGEKCEVTIHSAAAPQQPHPVGVTDAMRLDWLEQVRDRFYNIDHIAAIVGKGFLTQVGDAPMPGHFPNLREAIDSAAGFSHQQPAPSECCNTFPCKASTADNGACPVAAPSVSDLTNCRVPHSKYDACHNCDDPSAQDRECRCDFRTKLVGDGCEVCNPPHAAPEPAASGEGLPEIPTPHGGWNAERNEYDYTPAQLIAYAIEARRLTTTGQEPFAFRYVRESIEHCVSANEEGEDFAISRPMIDALTTLGLLEKVGRGLWAPTDAGKALAANPPATTGEVAQIDLRAAIDRAMEGEDGKAYWPTTPTNGEADWTGYDG